MSQELVEAFKTNAIAERSTSGTAAMASALVQSSFVVALNSEDRNWIQIYAEVLDFARRPRFADKGTWTRPVWDSETSSEKKLVGLSIRSVETMLQAMGHVMQFADVVHETDSEMTVVFRIVDAKKNITYSRSATLRKIVERRKVRPGQVIVGERETSGGNKVYLVQATEDEMRIKIAAAESKALNAIGRRIIPVDLQDEMLEAIQQTRMADIQKDPAEATKRMVQAFSSLGIMPVDIEKAVGHKMASLTPAEIDELRSVYQAIKDGITTWQAYAAIDIVPVEKAKINIADMKAVPPDEPEEKPKKAKKEKDPEPPASSPPDPIAMYNELLAELTENGAAYVDQLMAEKFGTSRIKDIPPMLHADLAAWLDTELVKELQQENFLPMPG